ncbi:DUF2268 domain-containing putative Zn-dependent protease [Bacillus sp. KH172YL63]|uniref:DUF2268 domain-containing putative Zn-dependent protease n=1 Tax=Bacillus sp. KH172YL63 TaxID=2709784 RepID=UPI0013E4EED0|nr:DUF2268 domain-containing putative Zn-dependent protease [Bacillus sp. KH172YL63]BCB04016.1 hypothetical protein KH172YL63_21490 [Bacillus sp. KH172YL63]
MKPNVIVIFVLTILVLTLASCDDAAETSRESVKKSIQFEDLVTTFQHPDTQQSFKIIHAYELFQNYIGAVADHPDDPYMEIYQEEVIDPIYEDCFSDGEFLYMADPILKGSPQQLSVGPTHLAEIQHLIDDIDTEKTENLIRESLLKSSELLPVEMETTVCVLPSKNKQVNMITVGAGKISVLYNPLYTEETLRAGVAHEYHHSFWANRYLDPSAPPTVLDNMIFEGKAVMFEKTVYPDIEMTRIDDAYNKDNWAKIQQHLDKVDVSRSYDIMMGGKGLPWGYGYSEGYKMVESYLERNQDLSPADWTPVHAKEIFEAGQYDDHYR